MWVSRVSKFDNFFLTCRNWANLYTWRILVLPFMENSIPTFQYYFSFCHLVCKLLKSHFSPFLLVSKLYELNLWFNHEFIFESSWCCYLSKVRFVLFVLIQTFSDLKIVHFLSVNYVSYIRPSYIYGQCWYWRFSVVLILRMVSFNS